MITRVNTDSFTYAPRLLTVVDAAALWIVGVSAVLHLALTAGLYPVVKRNREEGTRRARAIVEEAVERMEARIEELRASIPDVEEAVAPVAAQIEELRGLLPKTLNGGMDAKDMAELAVLAREEKRANKIIENAEAAMEVFGDKIADPRLAMWAYEELRKHAPESLVKALDSASKHKAVSLIRTWAPRLLNSLPKAENAEEKPFKNPYT